MNKTISLLILIALLAACSSTTFAPSSNELQRALSEISGQDGRACVRTRDIHGYGTLSDNLLSVSSNRRTQYLMVMMHRCPSLETNHAAAFRGAFTEFCGRRDSLFTGGERCMVMGVFEFENRDAAFAAHDEAMELIKQQREHSKSSD